MKYKVLSQNNYSNGSFSIVPIREQDRYDIMKWRNEQIYHLRQPEPLTKEKQDWYFSEVVSKLFTQDQPREILFSYLKDGVCIGYGGLVHINWIDKHAEISFIMNTELEEESFGANWHYYLQLVEQAAFEELNLHKLFVYAFDLRPHLYVALEANDYFLDARLKEHCFFKGEFKDVVIYSKISGT